DSAAERAKFRGQFFGRSPWRVGCVNPAGFQNAGSGVLRRWLRSFEGSRARADTRSGLRHSIADGRGARVLSLLRFLAGGGSIAACSFLSPISPVGAEYSVSRAKPAHSARAVGVERTSPDTSVVKSGAICYSRARARQPLISRRGRRKRDAQ